MNSVCAAANDVLEVWRKKVKIKEKKETKQNKNHDLNNNNNCTKKLSARPLYSLPLCVLSTHSAVCVCIIIARNFSKGNHTPYYAISFWNLYVVSNDP